MATVTAPVQHPNYWVARVLAERPTPAPARPAPLDWETLGFIAGLAVILAVALAWAWSPVVTYGPAATGYAVFWSLFWLALVVTAWRDCERVRVTL